MCLCLHTTHNAAAAPPLACFRPFSVLSPRSSAVREFEVGREFVLDSCVNVPEGLVGRTRGESPSDDSSGILHATDPPPSEPQTDSPLPSLLLSTLKAESVPSPCRTYVYVAHNTVYTVIHCLPLYSTSMCYVPAARTGSRVTVTASAVE